MKNKKKVFLGLLLAMGMGVNGLVSAAPAEPVSMNKVPVQQNISSFSSVVSVSTISLGRGILVPGNMQVLKPEQAPNKELALTLAYYYNVPKRLWAQTRYCYNYVHIYNKDVRDIVVLVTGPQLNGKAGSAILLINGKTMQPVQSFDNIIAQSVFLVDNSPKNKYPKNLVLLRSGGPAFFEYTLLKNHFGYYQSINSGKIVGSIANKTGVVMACNNLQSPLTLATR